MKNTLIASICCGCLILALSCEHQAGQAPIFTPEEALADFKIEDGFELELVAAEPLVQDPVAIAFDEEGALWVVEMRGYMSDENGSGEDQPSGRIKILRDLDGDGRCENMQIFADSLIMPRAVCPVYGGALVAEPPRLWFYEKNGTRTLIDSTYAEGGNPEHQPNGLLPAMDNWIYSAKSDKRYRKLNGQWRMEPTEFRGQWGIAQDDFGRLIYNDNSTTLRGDHFLPNTLPLLSNQLGEYAKKLYSAQLVENRVFPPYPTPGINRGYEPGMLDKKGRLVNVTGACGPSVYRGGAYFPPAYQGNAFVPEPCAQLVKRVVLNDSSGFITGKLPYREKEFLTSSDERFRPVNMALAPDGSLYLVDMHRGLIQHTTYLTPFLRKQVAERQLAQPTSLGRIYRIKRKDQAIVPPSSLANMQAEQLVAQLSNPNAWYRDKAQWLLVERRSLAMAPKLEELAKNAPDIRTRLHALWTLEGLGSLSTALLADLSASNTDPQMARAILALSANWSDFMRIYQKQQAVLEIPLAAAAARFCKTDFEKTRIVLTELAEKYAPDSLFASILAAGIWQHCTAAQINILKIDFLKKGLSPTSCLMQWLEKAPQDPQAIKPDLAHLSKLGRELFEEGKGFYGSFCSGCHGKAGEGLPNLAPPLASSGWATAPDKGIPIRILLDGLSGPITVGGKPYHLAASMPGLRQNQTCNDGTIAKILTFVRNSWGNRASIVQVTDVTRLRLETKNRTKTYTAQELWAQDPEPDSAQTSPPAKLIALFQLEQTKKRWKPLFDGSSLDGWQQVGGSANYTANEGKIVGTSVPNSPNSFLITKEKYADFILELEVQVDTLLNSGIQIRSNTFPNYNNGVFHGYQIEIDPSARAWSGGIYDESRRGWLFDLKGHPEAQAAFKKTGWNQYRIEALHHRIRTWINGVPVADLADSLSTCGHIGLQVHSIGQDSGKIGRQIIWRNIRLLDLGGIIWQADIETPENPVSAIFDNKAATAWQGSQLSINWREKKPLKNLQILFAGEVGQSFTIERSDDGVQWQTAFSGKTGPAGQWQHFPQLKGKTQHLRIASTSNKYLKISEIKA